MSVRFLRILQNPDTRRQPRQMRMMSEVPARSSRLLQPYEALGAKRDSGTRQDYVVFATFLSWKRRRLGATGNPRV